MTELYVSYDPVADALYIRVRGGEVADSVELAEGVVVDYNFRGEVVGVEVLGFSMGRIDLNEIVVRGVEDVLLRLRPEG